MRFGHPAVGVILVILPRYRPFLAASVYAKLLAALGPVSWIGLFSRAPAREDCHLKLAKTTTSMFLEVLGWKCVGYQTSPRLSKNGHFASKLPLLGGSITRLLLLDVCISDNLGEVCPTEKISPKERASHNIKDSPSKIWPSNFDNAVSQ